MLKESTEQFPIIVISESSNSDESDSSYEYKNWKNEIAKNQLNKNQDRSNLFKRVYPSDEEYVPACDTIKKRKQATEEHPSIFLNDDDGDGDDKESAQSNDEDYDKGRYDRKHDERNNDFEYMPNQMVSKEFLPEYPSSEHLPCLNKNSTSNEIISSEDSDGDESDMSISEDELTPADSDELDDLNSVTQSVISRFESWLRGPDGGRKDERCAQQCARQVKFVAKTIDPKNAKLVNLFDKITLREKWLVVFEKSRDNQALSWRITTFLCLSEV